MVLLFRNFLNNEIRNCFPVSKTSLLVSRMFLAIVQLLSSTLKKTVWQKIVSSLRILAHKFNFNTQIEHKYSQIIYLKAPKILRVSTAVPLMASSGSFQVMKQWELGESEFECSFAMNQAAIRP